MVRSLGGEPAGFASHLLVDVERDDCAFDPALVAIREPVRRFGPVRQGERIMVSRFWMDRDEGQGATAHNTTAPGAVSRWMTEQGLAWSFVVLRDTQFWLPFFTFIGFPLAEDAGFVLEGRSYGVAAHDWRGEPQRAWWEAVGRRYERGSREPSMRQPGPDAVLPLSQPDFRDAVRRAYRDYLRPDTLRTNPLLRSRLVLQRAGSGTPEETLRMALREAVESLNGHPKDQKLYRALWHTYIEPAPTQEAAAELLDLPFSTYRRHLSVGLERATDWLWRRELYGSS